MTTQYLLQLVISGLVVGSIYAAVALGFTIIYKATRVVNFAQGEFLMVGAYVCYAFLVQMHVPFWAALLLTIVFALVMAVVLERLVLRPMIGEPIISTSASKDGRIETDPTEIDRMFAGLDLVLDAGPGGHVPSTVLAILENGQIEVLREGAGPIDAVFAPQGSRPPVPPSEG